MSDLSANVIDKKDALSAAGGSDLSANVTWQEILREDVTHCRAIAAPLKFHEEIIESLARKVLGSYRPSHPDLLLVGSIDKAPDIKACRELINNIALKPVESQRRLAVIMCADKLLLPAANSLLKLSEEPPEHAYILFLMEDARLFLPTLRSRSRLSILISHDVPEIYPMPINESDWLKWLAKSRKDSNVDLIVKDLEAWANYALSNGFTNAAIIERLRIIAAKKNLSVPLLCDIIIMTLKEGKIHECIFNDLW